MGSLDRFLVLLCMLPALLLPRGSSLGWCVCTGCDEVAALSCCDEQESCCDEGTCCPEEDLTLEGECNGCHEVDVEPGSLCSLDRTPMEVAAPAALTWAVADLSSLPSFAAVTQQSSSRAPPGVPPHPGLRPGTRVLRI